MPDILVNQISPKISVVIPSFMREEVLLSTLEFVWNQDFPASDFEVILVDQTPVHEKEVEEALLEMTKRANFFWLRAQGWANLPAARNRGIEAARGELIVFIDDDVVLDPDFLTRMVEAFESSEAESVVGPVLMRPEEEPRAVRDGVPKAGDELGVLESRWVRSGRGCNMSFRQSLFEGAEGLWFDPRYLGNAILEETDVFRRLEQKGGRVWLEEGCALIHLADRVGGCRAATFKEGKRLPRHFLLYFHNHLLFGVKQFGPSGVKVGFSQFRLLGESQSMKGTRMFFLVGALFGGLFRLLVTLVREEADWVKVSKTRFAISKSD